MTIAQHSQGCRYCDTGRSLLCATLELFEYSGGARSAWEQLRSFTVPGTGCYVDRTVWQLVTAYEGITDLSGARFCDGGEVPTPELVRAALMAAPIVEVTP